MQRRGTVRFGTFLAAIVIAVSFSPTGFASASMLEAPVAVASSPASPADDNTLAPPVTVTDFYPESANLSDCVGLVEKPGCGSESRGGWRQILVFVVLFAGLGVILWRVSSGIKANRVAIDAEAERATDHPDTNR